MFIEEKYIKHYGKRVLTPFGYQTIETVLKTIPLPTLYIQTASKNITVCSFHTFIVSGDEIQAFELKVGDMLETIDGLDVVMEIQQRPEQALYDISLDQSEFDNQWYYSSGILSHNSGKSITVACYLCWLFTFFKEKNIGIVANRGSQAKEFLRNTKEIFTKLPMWMTPGVQEWNKTMVTNENEMRILTDVPSEDSFRGYTINCLVVDECAFIRPERWQEFADSIFPAQSALSWKKSIIISTAKGLNHFYDIVQRAKISNTKNKLDSNDHDGTTLVEVDWREVPRYRADGSTIPPNEFRNSIINKYGRAYFEQNYGNDFTGSAETMIDPDIINSMVSQTPQEIIGDDGKQLSIFEYPLLGNTYVMGVDASKDGEDAFGVQILDITEFPFKQVARAKAMTNYLEMPQYLYDWGLEYNSALMIIENNEGAGQSVADTLVREYEYPNIHFDTGKLFPGFRTTVKTRPTILKMLQVLLNASRLEIVDTDTIKEFIRFEKVNGKYQAATKDDSDDLIMSLALCLVPLINMDNFNDYKEFLKSIQSDKVVDTSSFLVDLSAMSFADI